MSGSAESEVHFPSRRLTWVAVVALGLTAAFFLLFPTALGVWLQLACFFALVPLGLAIHVVSDLGSGPRRRLLGPLALFVLAFAVVLGVRAIDLASGDVGRYFVVSGSGETERVSAGDYAADLPESLPDGAGVSSADSLIKLSRTTDDPWIGNQARAVELRASDNESHSLETTGPIGQPLLVTAGKPFVGSLAVRARDSEGTGEVFQLYARFRDADDAFISDLPLSGPTTAAEGWEHLSGAVEVPDGARTATLLLLLRHTQPEVTYSFDIDAPLLYLGRSDQLASYLGNGVEGKDISDAYQRALAIAIAVLLAVFMGYLLQAGAKLGGRFPRVHLADIRARGTRRLIIAVTLVGIVAYFIEMSTYGGYGGYLDSLSTVWQAAEGKWYLRALATAPLGIAVAIVVRRAGLERKEAWSFVEVLPLVIGPAIATSYFVKTTLVLPLLTMLLALYFLRRRAAIWLWISAGVFAVLTPFVYIVRGAGTINPADFVSAAYWNEFIDNLTSRFFQFESLMLVSPDPSSEAPWRPVADLFGSVIPRVVWDDKPLSASAEFTDRYLLSGLHTPTDIGVSSLPGEFWMLGGAIGVLVLGIVLGIVLRATHTALSDVDRTVATVLLCAWISTTLIQLSDGEGLASVIVLNLVAALGWLLLLRLGRAPAASADPNAPEPGAGESRPDGAAEDAAAVG